MNIINAAFNDFKDFLILYIRIKQVDLLFLLLHGFNEVK